MACVLDMALNPTPLVVASFGATTGWTCGAGACPLPLPALRGLRALLGHSDSGELVRKLYGHRDHERALDRVTAAYEADRAARTRARQYDRSLLKFDKS